MSLARIRDEYHVPARLGARVALVHCEFPHGTVAGSHDDFIHVDFDNGNKAAIPVADLAFLKS